MFRSLQWAGRSVRLLGVEGYGSARGADVLRFELQNQRPGRLLMESFAAGDHIVTPGAVVPYRDFLPKRGLELALERVEDTAFRETCTAEASATLVALQLGAEVCVGDRLHVTSFDRLIERHTLDELRHAMVNTVEMIAETLDSMPPGTKISELPQNLICPEFKELSSERHVVMAHLVKQTAEAGHDVALIVGQEHVESVYQHFGTDTAIEDLLRGSADSGDDVGSDAWKHEIEKRVGLAAFLTTTKTFPADLVLPLVDDLVDEAKVVVRKTYPKYRNAFMGRLEKYLRQHAEGKDAFESAMQTPRQRLVGVPQLEELCVALESPSS